MSPDLDLARRFLEVEPPPGTLLLCAVTGSHLYGFPSADSDIDLKGIHLAPLDAVLGLDPVAETHDRLKVFEGVECDLTTHEARKALGLLLRGNGNMLERLLAPLQLVDVEHETLVALGRGAISKRFAPHYAGFSRGVRREHERADVPRAKTLLYAYRVALTGVHLLRTGALECDLQVLALEHGFPEALELVALKTEGTEKVSISDEVDRRHRAAWPRLDEALDAAREASALPEEPPNRADCAAWLVETRRRYG